MSPKLVRHFWQAIACVSATQIRPLDDASLLQWLIIQVQSSLYLDHQQEYDLTLYISDRLPLIRDLCE